MARWHRAESSTAGEVLTRLPAPFFAPRSAPTVDELAKLDMRDAMPTIADGSVFYDLIVRPFCVGRGP